MEPRDHQRLWKPNVFLLKLKRKSFYLGGSENKEAVALTRGEEYSLYSSHVSSTTFNCDMDFKSFPFDQHVCYYEVRGQTYEYVA